MTHAKTTIFVLVVFLLTAACGSKDKAEEVEPISATPQMIANLGWVVDVLEQSGCLSADQAAQLKQAAGADLNEFAVALEEIGPSCAGSKEVIELLVQHGTIPSLADGKIILDSDGDNCLDSVYLMESGEIVSRDADGDGCMDRLWDIKRALERLELPTETVEELSDMALELYFHVIPPAYWPEPPEEEVDWPALRAQAEPMLDDLIAYVDTTELTDEQKTIVAGYLANTRPFVKEYVGFLPYPPEAPDGPISVEVSADDQKADEVICTDPESSKDQKWLCLYVQSEQFEDGTVLPTGHVWVGLVQGQDRFMRGLALVGHTLTQKTVAQIPSASEVAGDGSAEEASEDNQITPDNWDTGVVAVGSGFIRNENGVGWNGRVCWKITDEQWDLVAKKMNEDMADPPTYLVTGDVLSPWIPYLDLTMNCVTWAAAILELLDLSMPAFTVGEVGFSPSHAMLGVLLKQKNPGDDACITTVLKESETGTCPNGIVEYWQGETCDPGPGKGHSEPCEMWQFNTKGGWQKVIGVCDDCRCKAGDVNADPEDEDAFIMDVGCLKDSDCFGPVAQCFMWKCVPDIWDPTQPGVQKSTAGKCAQVPKGMPYSDVDLACNDDDPCTLKEQCIFGVCVGEKPCGNEIVQPDCKEACDPPGSVCTVMEIDGECTPACACKVTHETVGEVEWTGCTSTADCPEMSLPQCWKVWCNIESGICEVIPEKEDTVCDDGDKCTLDDRCEEIGGAIQCKGIGKNCDDGNPCTIDSCDPATGECKHESDPEMDPDGDKLCGNLDNCPMHYNPEQTDSDGDGIGDACECAYAVDCPEAETQCQHACNPETGECPPKPDQTPCDDGVKCTEGDECWGGVCVPGKIDMYATGCCEENEDCDDGNPCTNDWCEKPTGQCVNEKLGIMTVKEPCDNGDPCTVEDYCDDGQCKPGTVITCENDGNPCTLDVCKKNPDTGEADCHQPRPAGYPCEDGDLCTLGDYCSGPPDSVCISGWKLECPEEFLCMETTCEEGECAYEPVEGCCEKDEDCDDGDDCTVDQCDLAVAQCIVAEYLCTGACCSDGGDCTVKTPQDCADNGNIYMGNGTACDDEICGEPVICDPGTFLEPEFQEECLPCPPDTFQDMQGQTECKPCECDEDLCTDHSCDPTAGCLYFEMECDDGNICTEDICDLAIGCVFVPDPCDDENECTDDGCDPATGCYNEGVICNDQNICTTDECEPDTGCVFTGVICDPGGICNTAACDPATGCYTTPIPNCCDPELPDSCGEGKMCTCGEIMCTCEGIPSACCIGPECNQFTVEQCEVEGGVFMGSGVSCGPPNPCDSPTSCAVGDDVMDCSTAWGYYPLPMENNKATLGYFGGGDVVVQFMVETAVGSNSVTAVQVYDTDADGQCAEPLPTLFKPTPSGWEYDVMFSGEPDSLYAIEMEFDPTVIDPPNANTVHIMFLENFCG